MSSEEFPMPTMDELTLIGVAVLDLVGTCMTLGHSKPQHSLDYIHQECDFSTQVVHDLVSWCSGRKSLDAEGREKRLREYVDKSGWRRAQHERAMSVLGLDKLFGNGDEAAS